MALLWRVMTLRRLPKGWWVVFEDKQRGASQVRPADVMDFAAAVVLAAFFFLGTFIHVESTTTSFLYDVNDPQQSVITEVSVRTDRHFLATIGSSYTIRSLPTTAPLVGPTLRTGYKRSTRIAFGRDPSGLAPDLRFSDIC